MTFWTCSTELDILDEWKETTVVYCLLDQTQPVQYIRIQKAFLGPDNALSMAQQFDSSNYVQQISIKVEGVNAAGNVMQTFSTEDLTMTIQPDTFPKEYGTFAGPVILYAFNTPMNDPTKALNSNYDYRIRVTNNSTGNVVTSSTGLIESSTNNTFNIVASSGIPNPATANSAISFVPTITQTEFELRWNAAPSARIYQPSMRFYYTEYYVNGDSAFKATPEWTLASLEPAQSALLGQQSLKFEKLSFYRFVAQSIAADPNVVRRRAVFVEVNIYAGNDVLQNYININGASNSIAQDRPVYTNIENGYGIFAARSRTLRPPSNSVYFFTLSAPTIDGVVTSGFKGLAENELTCHLLFQKTNGNVPGCQ
jgi:hypothetical protein